MPARAAVVAAAALALLALAAPAARGLTTTTLHRPANSQQPAAGSPFHPSAGTLADDMGPGNTTRAAGALWPRACLGACQDADLGARKMTKVMKLKEKYHKQCVAEGKCPTIVPEIATGAAHPCTPSTAAAAANTSSASSSTAAGEYPCHGIDLLALVPILQLGSSLDASDIWGWTSAAGEEIAIIGLADGTSFVQLTPDPTQPTVLGFLPQPAQAGAPVIWRDIKVYKDHAFIVSESKNHGMQVVDLNALPKPSGKGGPPPTLEATAFYGEFGSAHNIAINEDTGHAFVIGTTTCRGGLHMVDITSPLEPVFMACRSEEGYTHDTQAVVYSASYPDARFHNQELTFNYNEDSLAIVDVTDAQNPLLVAKVTYDLAYYTHQGWLTADGTHLIMNDELDEVEGPNPHTRTMIWNVENLEKPTLVSSFYSTEKSIDHNLYVKGDQAFLSNYCAGLRVLDVSNIADVKETAFFDVDPDCDTPLFSGAWSAYVYFQSGTLAVSSIERGLFLLRLAE